MSFLPPFYVHPAAFASAEPEPTCRWPRTGARESVGSLYRDYASRGPALQRNFYTHARDIYTFPHGFVTQPVDQEHDQPQHYPPPPPPSANNPVEHTYSRVPRPQFCPPSPRQSTILWNPSHSAPNDYHARRHVQSGWQQVCDSSEPMNSEDGSPRYRRGGMCDGRSLPQEPSGQYRTDTNASSTNRVRQAAAAWTNGQSTEAQYRSVFARESLSLAAVIPDPRLALGEGSSEANIAVPDDTATERSRPVAEPQTTLPATSAQEGDVDSPFGKVPPTPRVAPDELEYWISPREGAEYPRPPPEIQTHAEAMTWLNQQHRLRQDLPPVEDLSAVQQQEGLGIVVNAAPAQGLHETDDRNAQLSPMQILVTPADAGESDFTSQPPSQSTEGQVARNAMDHKATHVPRAGKERAKEEVVAEEAEVGIPGDIYDYHNRVPSSTLNKDRRATNFSTHPPSKLPPGYIKSKLLEPPGHRNTEVNFSASENDDGVEELVDGCMRDTDNILEVLHSLPRLSNEMFEQFIELGPRLVNTLQWVQDALGLNLLMPQNIERTESWDKEHNGIITSLDRNLARYQRVVATLPTLSHQHIHDFLRKIEQYDAKFTYLAEKIEASFEKLRLLHTHTQMANDRRKAYEQRKEELDRRRAFDSRFRTAAIDRQRRYEKLSQPQRLRWASTHM